MHLTLTVNGHSYPVWLTYESPGNGWVAKTDPAAGGRVTKLRTALYECIDDALDSLAAYVGEWQVMNGIKPTGEK